MNPLAIILQFLIARLAEPSSHAGIAAVAYGLAQIFPQYAAILNIVGAVFGGNAVLMPDAKKAAQAPAGLPSQPSA